MLGFKKGDKENQCYRITLPPHYFSTDHDSYIFMSAFSGNGIAQQHVIHKARFIDTKHLHDDEEIDSENDRKAFTTQGKDILRKGAIMQNDQFTIESYNNQLIKHNKMYSTLVSEFVTNSETIIQHLSNLPHHEVASDMAK